MGGRPLKVRDQLMDRRTAVVFRVSQVIEDERRPTRYRLRLDDEFRQEGDTCGLRKLLTINEVHERFVTLQGHDV